MLKNGTKSLAWWIESPLKPHIKIHIFNYTNIDAVLKGRETKIKVEDVGPYVYEEKAQRVMLSYLDGNKITSYVSCKIIILKLDLLINFLPFLGKSFANFHA